MVLIRFICVYDVERLYSAATFLSSDRRIADRRKSLIERKSANVSEIFYSGEAVGELCVFERIYVRVDLIPEPSLFVRKEAICERLRELNKERAEFSYVKVGFFLRRRLVGYDLVVCAEIFVNGISNIGELFIRDRRRLVRHRRIFVSVIRYNNAGAVIFEGKVISDKFLAALSEILVLYAALNLERTANNGDEFREFTHTLIECIRGLEYGCQWIVSGGENIVIEKMLSDESDVGYRERVLFSARESKQNENLALIFF